MSQYHGARSYPTVTDVTVGRSAMVLALASLLHMVQLVVVPQYSVLPHCYIWYNRSQYHGTRSHPAVTYGAVGRSATVLGLTPLLQMVQ